MRAVVVALGKIGLPLATQIARAGHEVVGCDIDAGAVDLVNAAQPPFPGEAGLAEALAEVVGDGRLRATTDTTQAVAGGADLVVAVPPLVVDADARPDFGALDSVLADIGAGLKAGTTVAVETTLPVGTTRNRVAPALAHHSGLRAEDEFFSVFSPERVYSGRVFRDLATYPKLLGGLSAAGEARGVKLYRSFLDAEVWPMGSAEAAELTKLAETTYRDVNIALANEFARPSATSTAPGSPSGATASRSTRASTSKPTPARACRPRRARSTRRCRPTRSICSRPSLAPWPALVSSSSASPIAATSRRQPSAAPSACATPSPHAAPSRS